MKRVIRILIPFLLAITIVLCMLWYLFVYDRAFTRDLLLSCARYFEDQGDHAVASWFYDKAYIQATDSDAVAIELANQYKSVGNYTKAEFTLSNAIADGGGLDLYVALCKTYVEQDKLMDAVNMLNNISNPKIKAQIDNLRPEAPTVSPEPAFYNQYISVSLQAKTGVLYVTTNGEYPSIDDAPYAKPISLHEGENTIYAVSVTQNGLVSPLSIFGYTVGGVVELVEFADPSMEAEIRTSLGVDIDKQLYTNDLWTIKEFVVPNNVTSFADLKHMVFLEHLVIQQGATGDLKHLSSLANLETLNINGVTISHDVFNSIASLPKLKELTLQNCGISNISSLSSAKNLITLNLSNNAIRDVSTLSAMEHLQELYLQHNAVVDITPLSSISTLKKLNLSSNALVSIAGLTNITGLEWLDASTNAITDIGEVSQLTALKYLCLNSNSLTDISKLAGCNTITELYLSNNKLTDVSSLGELNNLMYLDISRNQIAVLPTWSADSNLVNIDCSNNKLTSLDTLAGLKSLNNVYADYNNNLKSISKLASCLKLVQVNVYGTKVTSTSSLEKNGIIVNYNPLQ